MTDQLVHTDVRGIQRFVFASAQLRDVIGRSAMVRHVVNRTEGPLADAARATGADVISAAGGRSVVHCTDEPTARSFAARYSRALLETCRELDPVITRVPVATSVVATLIGPLPRRCGAVAAAWTGRAGIEGLTVTELCEVTGRPAEYLDDPEPRRSGRPSQRAQLVASSVVAARTLGRDQGTLFEELLLGEHATGFGFPPQVEEMGRTTGTRSQVGVVHLDLDGLVLQRHLWGSVPAAAVVAGAGLVLAVAAPV